VPAFGRHSLVQRATLHLDLQRVLDRAIERFDFQIVEGFRGKTAQNIAFAKGNSNLPWPQSNHNKWPSYGADIVPWPIDWSDKSRNLERFVMLQGVVWSCAFDLKIEVRIGIDWNRNLDMRDEKGLHDYPHVELFRPRILTPAEFATYPSMPDIV
jgi:peptidoglycan L-alanyl-D-glutamate endopeptidase CwlK